jgi:glycosyltransferase involved in cell wall biosynthesis
MDIVLDSVIYSLQKKGGISTYWRQLSTLLGNNVVLEIVNQPTERDISSISTMNVIHKSIGRMPLALSRYCPVHINSRYRPSGQFIFHSSYYRWCTDVGAVNITTVHDFIYERFRHDTKSVAHKKQKMITVHKSDGIICNSESTRKDFFEFYPKYKGQIEVIPMGVSSEYIVNNNLDGARDKYLLFVGSRSGYKNFIIVAKALSVLRDYRLRIVGGGPLSREELAILKANAEGRYETYLNINDEALSRLYQDSFCLLYPSLYEGFGIPIIEAMSCGCPVVCQKNSSIIEVAGSAGVYMESNAAKAIVDSVKQLEVRQNALEYKKKGYTQSRKYTWERTARLTLEFYKKVFEVHSSR